MGIHYERARLLTLHGRYDQAERELREDLAENPHSGLAHALLGRCLNRQGRLAEAATQGEEAVRLAPDLSYAHFMLGLTYNDLGRLEHAEASLREALRLNPRNAEHLEWLSWIQYLRGDRRGALATVNQGLEIEPQSVGCLNRRGYYLRWLGDWKESEVTLRAALALSPENSYTHTNLAWTLWTKAYALARTNTALAPWAVSWRREVRDARRHFLEALRLDPNSDWARTGVAEILLLRRKAVLRFLMLVVLVVTGAFLKFTLDPDLGGPGANAVHPSDSRFVMGLLVVLFGAATVFFSNGPVYALMRCSRLGAAVLSPARSRAAKATLVCLTVAAGAALAALLTLHPAALAALLFSLAIIGPLTLACEASHVMPRTLLWVYSAILAAVGLACLAFALTNQGQIQDTALVVLLTVVGVGSLASSKVARLVELLVPKKSG